MTNTDQPTSLGSGTVAALESAYADIRSLHPELPADVVFRLGSGAVGRRGSLVLGSVTVHANWQEDRKTSSRATSAPTRFRELFISGELLAGHPVRLMQTLIHESVHLLAIERGISDTSRQHRYHSKKFRTLAEELGLEWTHLAYQEEKDDDGVRRPVPNPDFDEAEPADIRTNPRFLTRPQGPDEIIGFSDMHITKATAGVYADTIANLDSKVSVSLGGGGVVGRAPKKRRTVLLLPVFGGTSEDPYNPGLVGEDEFARLAYAKDDVQRLGVVVYEGLVSRQLLAPHVAMIAEVG